MICAASDCYLQRLMTSLTKQTAFLKVLLLLKPLETSDRRTMKPGYPKLGGFWFEVPAATSHSSRSKSATIGKAPMRVSLAECECLSTIRKVRTVMKAVASVYNHPVSLWVDKQSRIYGTNFAPCGAPRRKPEVGE